MPNHGHLLLKTGGAPIARIMQCLLTGHAGYFNRRHQRHGKLFQNRYKSILCQEDVYLQELVRYIHLNPIRAGIVGNLERLDRYLYTGHSAIMGRVARSWQDEGYVLRRFAKTDATGRRRYREFLAKGIAQGKRPELTGGGLIRSLGGWSEVRKQKAAGERIKSDERMLGDSEFVASVLQHTQEQFERRYALMARGMNWDTLARRVEQVLEADPGTIWQKGRVPAVVRARSLFCYWAARELGIPNRELAKRFGLTQPAVSLSVQRGQKIAAELGVALI
jgi:hypothetical protein